MRGHLTHLGWVGKTRPRRPRFHMCRHSLYRHRTLGLGYNNGGTEHVAPHIRLARHAEPIAVAPESPPRKSRVRTGWMARVKAKRGKD